MGRGVGRELLGLFIIFAMGVIVGLLIGTYPISAGTVIHKSDRQQVECVS